MLIENEGMSEAVQLKLAAAKEQQDRARKIYNEQVAVNPMALSNSGRVARDGIISVLETIYGDDL